LLLDPTDSEDRVDNIEYDFLMICVNILENTFSFITKFGCSDVNTIRTLVFHVLASF
jgi:hypothetical protein